MAHRALVVDDEEGIVFTFKTILESSGFEVETASSAQSARESLAAAPFDIVITDMRMESDTAGYEVAEAAAKQLPPPVVIVISAYAELMQASRQCGVHAVFDKPTNLPKLLQTIAELLAQNQRTRAA